MRSKKSKSMEGNQNASRWRDEYYVEIYDLVRQGMGRRAVAEILGVDLRTITNWVKSKPVLRAAINKALKFRKHSLGKAQTFMEYVYQQLPTHLKEIWKELCAIDKKGDVAAKMKLIAEHPERIQQQLFIHALVCNNFKMNTACKKSGVSFYQYNKWLTDPNFAELIEQVIWHKKNFFESALIRLVEEGNASAIMFANKTQNKDRGYNPQVEHHHSGGILHASVELDALDNLPAETKRQLLTAMRERLCHKEPPKIIEALPARVIEEIEVVEEDENE